MKYKMNADPSDLAQLAAMEGGHALDDDALDTVTGGGEVAKPIAVGFNVWFYYYDADGQKQFNMGVVWAMEGDRLYLSSCARSIAPREMFPLWIDRKQVLLYEEGTLFC